MPKKLLLISHSDARATARLGKVCRSASAAGMEVYLMCPHAETETGDGVCGVPLRAVKRGWNRLGQDALARIVPDNLGCGPLAPTDRAGLSRWRRAGVSLSAGDWILAHHWTALPIARAVQRASDARLVYDVSELAIASFTNRGFLGWLLDKMSAFSEARLIGSVDCLIAHAPAYLARGQELCGFDKPAFWLENRVETPVKNALESIKRPIKCLYQGLALPNRGVDLALDAIAEMNGLIHVDLQMVGNARRIECFQIRTAELGLQEKITFLAPGRAIELADQARDGGYSLGLCFLDPADPAVANSLPNKLFDMMAAGVVPIVCKGTVAADYVRGLDCAIILPAFTSTALRDALDFCIARPHDIMAMARNCLEHTRTNPWSKSADDFISYLNKNH